MTESIKISSTSVCEQQPLKSVMLKVGTRCLSRFSPFDQIFTVIISKFSWFCQKNKKLYAKLCHTQQNKALKKYCFGIWAKTHRYCFGFVVQKASKPSLSFTVNTAVRVRYFLLLFPTELGRRAVMPVIKFGFV